ncbi:MAG: heparan-alpha-glucosaminide N-acetyltransferase domain-containing protein [Flavobacteriaceae bacterium]
MGNKTARLFFIDAMRAWAILMMLQGHFVDGLLEESFRDPNSSIFTIWKYFRGITAPVFFTVSGFIFTYLLIRVPQKGFDNPRVIKGIRRGIQLLFIGYLLRLNLFGLLKGEVYETFYLVDVLHIIGLSILGIIAIYLITKSRPQITFAAVLLFITVFLFALEPVYQQWTFTFMPDALANYFTRANGSVFSIIPWFGYATFGAFSSVIFTKFRDYKYLYPVCIGVCAAAGLSLIYYSSPIFMALYGLTGIQLFEGIYTNNYLFIRLGDVFIVFAIFMALRHMLTGKTILSIGQNTLSIYVIHFIFLYGSFTGLGLYRFFHNSLSPVIVIPGALMFMICCAFTALWYSRNEQSIKIYISKTAVHIGQSIEPYIIYGIRNIRILLYRVLRSIMTLVRS